MKPYLWPLRIHNCNYLYMVNTNTIYGQYMLNSNQGACRV